MYLARILIIAKGLAICEVGGYMITCKKIANEDAHLYNNSIVVAKITHLLHIII